MRAPTRSDWRLISTWRCPNTVTINTGVTPATATVVVTPYVTMATSAQDTKHIRIRGPLVNSSVNVGTFSIFVRPFNDEVNSAGSLIHFQRRQLAVYAGWHGLCGIRRRHRCACRRPPPAVP